MSLLNPLGLLGLLSLPIVAALHLRRERSQRFVVSSLRLWQFLDEKMSGQRARNLPITLLLILDLLVALFFTLALSQPQIKLPAALRPGTHTIILLDTSTSMLAEDFAPSRFEAARADVLDQIRSASNRDIVSVITFGGTATLLGDSRDVSAGTLEEALVQLKAGAVSVDFIGALSLGLSLADPNLPLALHIYTDGAYPDPELPALPVELQWHWYAVDGNNQGILLLEVDQFGANRAQIYGVLSNLADQPVVREALLFADGQLMDRVVVELPPQSNVSKVWPLIGQPRVVELILEGNDQLPADDRAAYTINPAGEIRAALVGPGNPFLVRALQAVDGLTFTTIEDQDVVSAFDYDLAIYYRTLPDPYPAGLVVLVEPPTGGGLSVAEVTPTEGALRVQADPLLEGIDFSGLRIEQVQPVSADWLFPILEIGEDAALLNGRQGLSNVYVLTAPLGSGNLTSHPAFPLLFANAADLAAGQHIQPFYALGDGFDFPRFDQASAIEFRHIGGESLLLDSRREQSGIILNAAGIYEMIVEDYSGERTSFALAVNAGDAHEIRIAPRAWVGDLLNDPFDAQGRTSAMLDLTPWLLVLGLAVLYWEARHAWR
jgi:hypothetical protein